MIFAVLDTNILVSFLMSKSDTSTISRLLSMVRAGRITTLYCDDIISEYNDVLYRPKFNFNPQLCEALIDSMKLHGINSERIPFETYMPDETDRVFYEVALSKENAYLVTGNQRHFPHSPIVVTPAEMLEIVSKANGR